MWALYKKRFWTTQLFVGMLMAIAAFGLKVPGPHLIMIFLSMQLGALLGALMGARIRRQLDYADDLPLNRR